MPPEPAQAELAQVEHFEFRATFPEAPYGPLTVDEGPPVGSDHGPNPVRTLALAVGHCMSSTLVSTCERAHVPIAPVRTVVRATVGRNEKGRLRVQLIEVDLRTAPQDVADAERFAHCVEIFPDFCTVSGAVRAGVAIAHRVVAP
jgi:organic hydroperoxide reductase OsmC/OhrA